MIAVGGAAAILLLAGTGWSLFALLPAGPPQLGRVALIAGSYIAGAAALSFLTTVVGVLGGPVHVWPLIGPLMLTLFAAGVVRAWRRRSGPAGRIRDLRGNPAGLIAAIASAPLLVVAAAQHMTSNDEYAIWAFKGRILDAVGHLDTYLLSGDPTYAFSHRDYPLMLPSLLVWGDGWAGADSERLAHELGTLLTVCALIVVVSLLARLSGTPIAVLGLLLLLAVTGFMAQATGFVGDAPTATLALGLLLSVVLLTQREPAWVRRDAAVVASVCASAAAMTKNEGTAFVVAALVAALLFGRASRRALWVPAVTAAAAVLPWMVWWHVHGLQSDFVNSDDLKLSAVRAHSHRFPHILGRVAHYWPGLPWAFLALAAIAIGVATVLTRDRSLLVVPAGGLLALGVVVVVEMLAPEGNEGFYLATLPRVLLFPAAALSVSGPIALGRLLRRDPPGLPDEVRQIETSAGCSPVTR
jgi:hypothetical protein